MTSLDFQSSVRADNQPVGRWLAGAILALAAIGSVAEESSAAPPEGPVYRAPDTVEFPQRREVDGMTLILHAPQIRSWPDFERFEALVAVEVSAEGDTTPRFGTAELSGDTEVDLKTRLVRVTSPSVDNVKFPKSVPDSYRDPVLHAVSRSELDIPLDLFLAYLADDLLAGPPPPGFNTEPPPIVVRTRPTILLSINGEPISEDVPQTGLKRIVNANWPLFLKSGSEETYYLLERDLWLTSNTLDKGWKAAKSLPAVFADLPDEPPYQVARAAYPLQPSSRVAPQVLFVTTPTELIVTEGPVRTEVIAPDLDLEFVSNTDSPLFRHDGAWYYLVAGRWFTTTRLDKGPWSFVTDLPTAFADIPTDHRHAVARASVPGTMEARTAAVEALVPTKVATDKDATPPVEVAYAGEPVFEAVPGTDVARAVNTGFDIIEHRGVYYLLYSAVWYEAPAPIGPWSVTADVPAAIYQIPPSSPSYNVTQVTVAASTPTSVVYSYPPSYSSNVYVAYGVTYYSTGWYYPPYVYGGYYYPYPAAYGYGSWYNPNTGGYGSRSVVYGPYGGYSYNQGYNPSTGGYGYVETAWDGDEWASHGETYNPRTGVQTETSRYYDDDKERSEMERTTQRGDEWVKTERNVDYDDRIAKTERETSQGGSSSVKREASGGTISSSGTINTGDGRSYTTDGTTTRDGGSTTITGAEGSASIETQRQDGKSISSIEGSGGGQGVSMSGQGPGRTTIGQSSSGDLYAGHNGNVYKKTDEGWQNYQDGNWQQVDMPNRPENLPTATSQRSGSYSSATSRQGSAYGGQRAEQDFSQLNRDYGARQQGSRQYQQRSGGMSRGGGRGRGR